MSQTIEALFPKRLRSSNVAKRMRKHFKSKQSPIQYVRDYVSQPCQQSLILYFHIPYCNKICSFCPFYSPAILPRTTYDDYIINQLEAVRRLPFVEQEVSSIYFGGGTPTTLSPDQLARIFQKIREVFHLSADVEISLETSCTELTDDMLDTLVDAGVNRLSIGVQTFNDDARKMLGRRGSGEHAANRVRAALDKGIDNTNVDIIYNYPKQKISDLEQDLQIVKDLNVAGLSFYPLNIFPDTPLAGNLSTEELAKLLTVPLEYEFFSCAYNSLYNNGFRLLELTKMVQDARDSYQYVFLKRYSGDCLAFGLGAGGSLGGYRYVNPKTGLELLADDLPISSRGNLYTDSYRQFESALFDIKTGNFMKEDLEPFYSNTKNSIDSYLDLLMEYGLLSLDVGSGIYSLTLDGMFWGSNIIEEIGLRLID